MKVGNFLFADQAFSQAFDLLRGKTKTLLYPTLLKKDRPGWPMDYSEVFAERIFGELAATVFGVGSSPGGTPLGTGFFAKRGGDILFMTAGHWAWNKRIYVMQQKNSDPYGTQKSELVWLNEQLDLFNFSEQLLDPTLKAMGFNGADLQVIKNKLGSNPFGSSFGIYRELLPWTDMALALPARSVIQKTGLEISQLAKLHALPENSHTTTIVMGFGITEDLISSGFVRRACRDCWQANSNT